MRSVWPSAVYYAMLYSCLDQTTWCWVNLHMMLTSTILFNYHKSLVEQERAAVTSISQETKVPDSMSSSSLRFLRHCQCAKCCECINLFNAHNTEIFTSVWISQFNSVAQSYLTLCNCMDAARQASLSITNSLSLLKLMSIESVITSNHLILCHPPLLPPSIFPNIRVFSNESALHIRWPKYWSFSCSISPSNEYSGLISIRMDWLDLLEVQGTLKSLFQHHSSKASSLQH